MFLKSQKRLSKRGLQMINVRLDYVLLDKRMKLKDLAQATGLAVNNLSILKTNKARAIRFSTLNSLCRALNCTPGDLIEYIPDEDENP
jgi:putative transcriptional regulator